MTVISFQIISGGVVQTRVGGLIRKRVPQMRAAQQIDGHILDSICSFDCHRSHGRRETLILQWRGLPGQTDRGRGLHEQPDGERHRDLQGQASCLAGAHQHPGLQDPIHPLKNAPMLKNMDGRGGGSGATRGKNGILRAKAGAGGRG